MTLRKLAQFTGHNAAVFAIAGSEDDRHFYSGAGDGWVVRWDLSNPEMGKLAARTEAQIFSLCLLKNESRIVAGNMDGGIHWIDLQDAANTKNIVHHQKGIFDILAANGSVFTAGGDGKLTRWLAGEQRSAESYHLANQSLRCLDFCEKRNEIAAGSSDHSIYLLDAATLELRQVLRSAHRNSVFTVRYSPGGRYLLSGGRDAHLNFWDLEGGHVRCVNSQPAHWFTINDIAFHPQGRYFATASRDKTIKIWDAGNFSLLKVLEGARDGGHFNSVNKLFWSKFENLLISASDDRTLIAWQFEAPEIRPIANN